MVMVNLEQIPETVTFAKALADDTRQRIMELCCCNPMTVNELVDAMGIAQPTVSHHLAILRNAGLVHVERQGKHILYQINQQRLAENCCQVARVFAPGIDVEVSESKA
jgi:DNA-binding transcriptional ArsR family regulator